MASPSHMLAALLVTHDDSLFGCCEYVAVAGLGRLPAGWLARYVCNGSV